MNCSFVFIFLKIFSMSYPFPRKYGLPNIQYINELVAPLNGMKQIRLSVRRSWIVAIIFSKWLYAINQWNNQQSLDAIFVIQSTTLLDIVLKWNIIVSCRYFVLATTVAQVCRVTRNGLYAVWLVPIIHSYYIYRINCVWSIWGKLHISRFYWNVEEKFVFYRT